MNSETPADRTMDLFRTVALIVVAAGTVASEILLIREDPRTQPLLSVAFVIWVLLPFVAWAWAIVVSKRWAAPARFTLYGATLLIVLGSVAFYGRMILQRGTTPHAFVFVMGPLASWALMLVVVPIAVAISRKR